MKQNTHIKRAVKHCENSQSELARRMGGNTRQGHVYQWLNNLKIVSAESAVLIEIATKGEVTRQQLRPDLFGALKIPAA